MSKVVHGKVFPKAWAPRWQRLMLSFLAGAFVFDLGHKILGVRLELFWGIQGYDLAWAASLFVVPVLTGIVVGLIYGWGGKLVAHLPPLVVLGIAYYSTFAAGAPEGARLIPLMWFGFFVLLSMEFCAVGGVIGELLLKRWYGTLDMPGTADYAHADAEPLPNDDHDGKA